MASWALRTKANHQRRPPAFARRQRLARHDRTDHDVHRDSASCLPANPSSHGLQRAPPPSQHPSPCACCTVATGIEWKATPAEAVKGRGGWSRRKRTTRNSCGGILLTRHVGHVDRARPAPSPPWECASALQEPVNLPNKSSSRKRWSTRDGASSCQPRLLPGSNSSGSWESGLAPFRMAIHDGGLHTKTPSGSQAASWAARKHCVGIVGMRSAQLAQLAENRTSSALRRPRPPSTSGSDAMFLAVSGWTASVCKMSQPHRQTPSSWACANSPVLLGSTERSIYLARADAQCRRRSQALCKSKTRRILCNRTRGSCTTDRRCLATKSGDQAVSQAT